jgi:hypothetical protein
MKLNVIGGGKIAMQFSCGTTVTGNYAVRLLQSILAADCYKDIKQLEVPKVLLVHGTLPKTGEVVMWEATITWPDSDEARLCALKALPGGGAGIPMNLNNPGELNIT